MEYRQTIRIEGRSIDDIFKLPCVYSCHKEADGRLCYILYDWDDKGQYIKAHVGDTLCEDYEGKWIVRHEGRG